ncbi:MAG: hypothetical protein QM778_03055 [Myxococcales bacterium]
MLAREDLPGMESVCAEMLNVLDPADAIYEAAIAFGALTRTMFILGNKELAKRLLAATLSVHVPENSLRARGYALSACMMAAGFAGDLGSAIAHGQRALTLFQDAGAAYELSLAFVDLGYWLLLVGAYFEAEDVLAQALEAPSSTAVHRVMYQQNLGLCALHTGRLTEAMDYLRASADGLAIWPSMHREHAFSLAHLAEAQLAQGKLEEADRSCQRALAVVLPETAPDADAYTSSVHSRVLLALGRISEADLASAKGSAALEGDAYPDLRMTICNARIECLLAAAKTEAADQLVASSHAWLSERAAKISDPAMRRRFLNDVPENRRALSLAKSRVGLLEQL